MGFITPIPPGGVSGIGGVTPIPPPEFIVIGPDRFPTTNELETGTGWVNPQNVYADDGVYATAAPAKNGVLGHRWGGFGWDGVIPVGAFITSVTVNYQYKVSTTASIYTMRMRARVAGVSQANHDDLIEPLADSVVSTDISLDRPWTRADLLDANFQIVFEARRGNSSAAVTASLDYVTVNVQWTMAQTLQVVPIPSAEAFGVPVVQPGAIQISPTGIESGEVVNAPVIIPEASPPTQIFNAGAIASAEAFGTPALTASITVSAGGIASAEAFETPQVLPGARVLSPAGIISGEAFGILTLRGLLTISPPSIPEATSFGIPTVGAQDVTVTVAGIPSAEAFGTPRLIRQFGPGVTATGARHGGVSPIVRRSPRQQSIEGLISDFEQQERGY